MITLATLITGYPWARHWLPIWMDASYLYLVTVATHIGYLFHFLCNTMYSSKHTIIKFCAGCFL